MAEIFLIVATIVIVGLLYLAIEINRINEQTKTVSGLLDIFIN